MVGIVVAKGPEATLDTVGGAAVAAAAPPVDAITELALATAILVPIIVFHGWALGIVSRLFAGRFAGFTPETALWRVSFVVGVTIAALVSIHLVETLLWTVPLLWLGILGNFRDAYYYVLEAYTTLGEGRVSLPDQWRLVGPVIAISGLFTFGWTAGILVYIMNEVGKLHAARSLQRGKAPPAGD